MDRDRDRRFDEPRRGGESYRPSERPFGRPPRPDARPPRSPPPFRPSADTWAPSGRPRPASPSPGSLRRRSRSPGYNRERERPQGYAPFRRTSPGPDRAPQVGGRSRSPPGAPPARAPPPYARGNSPGMKRDRDVSPPGSYHARSPKRERRTSPVQESRRPPRSPPPREPSYRSGDSRPPPGYRQGRSPSRGDGWREPYNATSWRRRSPSPGGPSRRDSAQGSTSTSRRSSPPQFSDKTNRTSGMGRSPNYVGSRYPQDGPPRSRSPASSDRFAPGRAEVPPNRPPSAPRQPSMAAPSPRRPEPSPRAVPENDQGDNPNSEISSRPQRPPSAPQVPSPGADQPSPRAPPTQPQNFSKPQAISPPAGPSASATNPAFQSGRGSGNAALLSAPTRPKGVASGPSNKERESWYNTPRPGGPGRRGPQPSSAHHGPPHGPRGVGQGSPHYEPHRTPSYHRGSSSSTYPQTKRFTNYLAGLPSVVPGGKLLPSGRDPSSEKRLLQLEADKEKLLEQIAEKQQVKRTGLREWDKLSRESTNSALRSDLAEGHLQRMTEGDGIGGGAAF